jgi:hypothetical protein
MQLKSVMDEDYLQVVTCNKKPEVKIVDLIDYD